MLLLSTSQCFASEWFDSLMNQNVSTPAVYMSQQRGYFTAGGIQSRTPNSRLRFVSVTPPKMTAGCGGIDMFWGGFTFLNPEYLIQAFQNILSHAPAFAFDLALKTLCESCSETMKALENIANKLNSMAGDECAIAKAGVNWSLGSLLDGGAVEQLPGSANPSWDMVGWVNDNVLKSVDGALGEITETITGLIESTVCHLTPSKSACVEFIIGGGSFWYKIFNFENKTGLGVNGDPLITIEEAELFASMFGDVYMVTNDGDVSGNGTREVKEKDIASVAVAIPPITQNYSPSEFLKPFTYINDTGTKASSAGPSPSVSPFAMHKVYNLTKSGIGGSYETKDVNFPDKLKFGEISMNYMAQLISIFEHGGIDPIPGTIQAYIDSSPIPLYSLLNIYAYKYYSGGKSLTPEEKKSFRVGSSEPNVYMGEFMVEPERRLFAGMMAIGQTQSFMTKWTSKAYVTMAKYRAKFTAGGRQAGYNKEELDLAFTAIQDRMVYFNSLLLTHFVEQRNLMYKELDNQISNHVLLGQYKRQLTKQFGNI